MRVMFAGPSGIGKTTLAKFLAEHLGVEFLSGSVSDLVPKTKEMPHLEMLSRDSNELLKEDYQILNLRNKLYRGVSDFVSDRSYLDLATYFIYKQASKVPSCEIDSFLRLCSKLLVQQCDILILLELTTDNVGTWITEDNDKRIVNNYFQASISGLMVQTLEYLGYKVDNRIDYLSSKWFKRTYLNPMVEVGSINNLYGRTQVIKIKQMNQELREKILVGLV